MRARRKIFLTAMLVPRFDQTLFDDGATLEWTRGDTFVLPAWRLARMTNAGTEQAYLFRFDDRPLITAIGAYRSESS